MDLPGGSGIMVPHPYNKDYIEYVVHTLQGTIYNPRNNQNINIYICTYIHIYIYYTIIYIYIYYDLYIYIYIYNIYNI